MNQQRVDTLLGGYDGPIFPGVLVDELNAIYGAVGASSFSVERMLEGIAKTIESFEKEDSPTTEDGYNWVALHFKAPEGKIVVLFPPITKDRDKLDEVRLDRSIAVYKQGEVGRLEIKLLLDRLHLRFPEEKVRESFSRYR